MRKPAADLGEDLIQEKNITVILMPTLQSPNVLGTKLDTSKANGFVASDDAPLGPGIFDILETKVESVVEPCGVADDIWPESVTLVTIHSKSSS